MSFVAAVILAIVVFWLVSHVSVILAVVLALLVLFGLPSIPVGTHAGYGPWRRR